MGWRDNLQRASWRGVAFSVEMCSIKAGRNQALHAFPERETNVVWIEDLGLAPRRMQFIGFLAGDDVAQQQERMLGAIETAGVGELVHPMLGSVTGKVVDFAAALRAEKGGKVELMFDFIQQPTDVASAPDAVADTRGDVRSAATTAQTATNQGFLAQADGLLKQGQAAVSRAVAAVRPFVTAATRIVGDASSVLRSVTGLAGSFGRYFGGLSAVTGALGRVRQVETTVTGALSQAAALRSAATRAIGTLRGLIG